jgi:hypothetical protein
LEQPLPKRNHALARASNLVFGRKQRNGSQRPFHAPSQILHVIGHGVFKPHPEVVSPLAALKDEFGRPLKYIT